MGTLLRSTGWGSPASHPLLGPRALAPVSAEELQHGRGLSPHRRASSHALACFREGILPKADSRCDSAIPIEYGVRLARFFARGGQNRTILFLLPGFPMIKSN